MKFLRPLAFLFFVALISSCQLVYRKMYGLNPNPGQTDSVGLSYGIPHHAEIARANKDYLNYLKDSLKFNDAQVKAYYQPLQVLYYDENGKLLLYAANCLVGGFPNLKWSRIQFFEPPNDTLLKPTYYPELNKVVGNNDNLGKKTNKTLVVFWNYYMGRQSKRFIKYLRKELQKHEKDSIRVVWVNNDAWFE